MLDWNAFNEPDDAVAPPPPQAKKSEPQADAPQAAPAPEHSRKRPLPQSIQWTV